MAKVGEDGMAEEISWLFLGPISVGGRRAVVLPRMMSPHPLRTPWRWKFDFVNQCYNV